jgi:cbb3-type cytochrome oxidase subunit 3
VKLSDVMSAMKLAHYAEIALVIFLGVFLAVIVHVLRSEPKTRWERARYLPLEDQSKPVNPRIRGTIDG